MIGIYRFKNLKNGKSYIGQSVNIEKRIQDHRSGSKNANHVNYDCKFYRAIRKYGFESYEIEVLEEFESIDTKKIDAREVFFIEKFDSFKNGYNSTPGGDFNPSYVPEIVAKRTKKLLEDKDVNKKLSHPGSKNPNAKLTEEDVVFIRASYRDNYTWEETFEHFKDKISKHGFKAVWQGNSWKNIMPEVYNERPLNNNGGSKLTDKDIIEIRTRVNRNQEPRKDVYKDFEKRVGYAGFIKIINGYTWKHIKV